MKLNKDQVRKAALVGLCAAGALYYYGVEMLGPLSAKASKAGKACDELRQKIDEARPKINRVAAVEAGDPNAAAAREIYAAMDACIPSSDPIAWFPTRLTGLFRAAGIPKQNYRCNAASASPQFPGYKPSNWSIELPGVDFVTLGKSLAALENQEGLIQITGLQVEATLKEPDKHHAQLTLSTLVKDCP